MVRLSCSISGLNLGYFMFGFFFSSRRRHTRFDCDWSSDACSSDLRALELLARVGLSHRVDHRPSELSGGEQQRTAVARALALDPAIFLADEPSGNLDHANAENLHDLLASLARDLEIAMVVVTHNRSLAKRADRALQMEDGVLREADVQGVFG